MAYYTFVCNSCGSEEIDGAFVRIGADLGRPSQCCSDRLIRRASFSFRRSLAAHFNQSTGTYVSNERQFSDDLKRKSEEASIRTNMEHNFQPVDITDMKALGVTDEGLENTKRRRRAEGLDPPSTTKVII